ncbi:hypothetical protein GE118_00875 [Mycoplasma sp. NEAQ87857]|uniref:ABC transporter thiamine pyrophosphate-binding lipoprotein p37/Cypl n=1 Tax=Mycoplasma sp. NEAQ87857 TaxID=2683967 RepID=UPI0013160DE3|nr:hypothetical protein [Mycoplasma sp. NEAQ87857]QGZ97355.1 hypothetical protein GE118_00875 [Mycoplasma sp. NEAQ87857]
MKKFKNIIKYFLATSTIITTSVVSFSCAKNSNDNINEKQVYKLNLDLGDQNKDLTQQLTTLLNNQLKNNGQKFKIEIINTSDSNYDSIRDKLNKGEIDFAFVSTGSLYSKEQEIKQSGLLIKLQTLTKKFKGDVNASNQTLKDLENIAKNEYQVFTKIPREQWNDKENGMGWNGTIYTRAYDDHQNVPYQRGLITILANEQDTKDIIEAWNNKDYKKFISYKLGIGKSSSGSKYILPQALLKKNFPNQFISLKQLMAQGDAIAAKLSEPNSDVKIYFENEGFYGYNKVKNPDKYPLDSKFGRISFLTVTDKLPYNVGVFAKGIKKEVADAIALAFTQINDPWGPTQGFNGYKVINDSEQEFWNVINQSLWSK